MPADQKYVRGFCVNLNTQVMDLGAVNIEYLLSGIENRPVLTFVHGLSANLRQYLAQMVYFRSNPLAASGLLSCNRHIGLLVMAIQYLENAKTLLIRLHFL